MTEGRHSWYVALGLVGVLVVAVAASSLPGAVFVGEDATVEPREPTPQEEQLLEETLGQEPTGGDGGDLPAEWILIVAGVVAALLLVRIAATHPRGTTIALLGSVGVASLVVVAFVSRSIVDGAAAFGLPPGYVATVVIGVAFALGIAGTLVAFARHDRPAVEGDDVPPSGDEDLPPRESTATASSVRIDPNVDADDNDVYRAWMTLAESVSDRLEATATPGDVMRAALEEGHDRSAVESLTRLFEDVRYGGRDPTPERERRARELLERIGGDA